MDAVPLPLTSLLSLLLTITALTLVALTLRGLPLFRAPPRRCPRCWYDLAGLPTTRTCPECGYAAATERRLHKRRRPRQLAAVSVLLFLAAYAAIATPRVRARGWIGAVPTTVLVLLPPHLSADDTPDLFYAVLDEVQERRLRAPHRELLFRSCLRGHPERRPGTESWEFHEGRVLSDLRPDGGFSERRQRRLWTALAPALLPTRGQWPAGVPVRIGTLSDDNSITGWYYGKRDRLLTATVPSLGLAMSMHLHGWDTEHPLERPVDHESADRPDPPHWTDGTIDLGPQPPGTRIAVCFELLENDRLLWSHTCDLVTVTGAIADHLTPILSTFGDHPAATPFFDNACLDATRPGIVLTPDLNSIAHHLRGGAFAVAIDVCKDGRPVASGRYWTTPEPDALYCFPPNELVRLEGDLTDLLASPDDDDSWTVRFRGDPETALRDPAATHYWSGEFTLTRGQFTVQR